MKTISTDVYEFSELNDKAKKQARAWFREGDYDENWQEAVEEDAKRIGLKVDFEVDSYSRACNVKLEVQTSTLQVAEAIVRNHGKDCATYKHAVSYLSKVDEETAGEEFIDALALGYRKLLQQVLDYHDSDEYIDESITLNEYTFTADGKRFG